MPQGLLEKFLDELADQYSSQTTQVPNAVLIGLLKDKQRLEHILKHCPLCPSNRQSIDMDIIKKESA